VKVSKEVQDSATQFSGDSVKSFNPTGRRIPLSPLMVNGSRGFSLIELIITVTVLTILTLGVLPLVKVAVRRQREQQLRESLRQMRTAIDEFHRDTIGMVCTGTTVTGTAQPGQPQQQPQNQFVDPRSKVVISDCTIFGVDNPDHYPPDLDTLVQGVNVLPRAQGQGGGRGLQSTGTSITDTSSTLSAQAATKKKVYLRGVPIDPITGKAEWDLRSCYDPADSTSWGGENVFDVRSKSKDKALNGEAYSDW
jgi:general secretion pathway protein G